MPRFSFPLLAALLLALPVSRPSRPLRDSKSPHAEITVVATVETAPRRTTHSNRREFEELDVLILSIEHTEQDDEGGEPNLPIDRSGPVRVIHDLTCGGEWIDAKPGDRLEIKGEYVRPSRGQGLIHFTHPSGARGGCGSGGGHPDGYLRLARPSAAAVPGGDAPGDLFTSAVRPILARRCAPCHEKGGKMYARLPFDDPAVVSSHAGGLRRRLKGDDLEAVERWLKTLPASGS